MPLTPTDLLEPIGDLSPELFPGKDAAAIDTQLQAYLTDGYGRVPATITGTSADNAAKAWAYTRAYQNVLIRLSRTPATANLTNEGSYTILGEQIRTFAKLATKWESEYNDIIGDAPSPDETPTAAALNQYIF